MVNLSTSVVSTYPTISSEIPSRKSFLQDETVNSLKMKLQKYFQEKIKLGGREYLEAKTQITALHQISLMKNDPSVSIISHIFSKAFSGILVYDGKGVDIPAVKSGNNPVYDMVYWLLGKKGGIPSGIMTPEYAKAFFLQKNPKFLTTMRRALFDALLACSQKLPVPGSPEEVVFQTFVGNIVALLPYSYPEVNNSSIKEEFVIPQKIDGQWKNCKYVFDCKIHLSPKWLSSPMAAYGLTSKEGPPILSFLGTTYPAGDGFMLTLVSDFTPLMSVGHAAYLYGKSEIERWMNAQKGQVRLHGVSLGGALCFQVLRNHLEKIGEVHAYNPPGLYPWNWTTEFHDPSVNIYCQENDIVVKVGLFPTGKGVSLFNVYGPKPENFLKAHAVAYSGTDRVRITKHSPEEENEKFARKIYTGLHFAGSLLIVAPLIAAAAHHVISTKIGNNP